jgi:tetratricopeptide (TPR) repeat protein
MNDAEKLVSEGKFADAAAAFEAIAASDPSNGVAVVRRARSLMLAGEIDRGIEIATEATKRADLPGRAFYVVAAGKMMKGDRAGAIEALEQSQAKGFNNAQVFRNDPVLAPLRGDKKFEAVVEAALRASITPEQKQLDFWVGAWDVYGRDGRQIGTNRLESMEMGRVIRESWTDASGGTGQSINFFNPVTKKMKQVWVDPSGNVLEMEGTFQKGAMRFEGVFTAISGTAAKHKTTLTPLPGGRVRQFIQNSSDDGKTYTVGFDAIYVPKGQSLRDEDRKEFEKPGDAER